MRFINLKYSFYIFIFLVLLSLSLCYASSPVSVDELLDKYDKTQKAMQNKYIVSETTREDRDSTTNEAKFYTAKSVYFSDGERIDLTLRDWIASDYKKREGFIGSKQVQVVWDGSKFYMYHESEETDNSYVDIMSDDSKKLDTFQKSYPGAQLDGFFQGNDKDISTIFREADEVKLYDTKENVNGSLCYVLEIRNEYGKQKIWLDSEHGYNICKAEVIKSGDDLYYGIPLSETKSSNPKASIQFRINKVEFEERNNLWIPMSVEYEKVNTYKNGKVITQIFNHIRKQVELSPDFKKLNAFIPNIKNDSMVYLIDKLNPIIPYHWVDGNVVPDVDDNILRSVNTMLEEITFDVLSDNISSEYEYEQEKKQINLTDVNEEKEILKTKTIISETYNRENNSPNQLIRYILVLGIIIVSIIFIFYFKKRKHV